MLQEESGRHFDPTVIEAFLRLMKQKEESESEGAMAPAPESSTPERRTAGPREESFADREADRTEPR
jgi:hypothetical protein